MKASKSFLTILLFILFYQTVLFGQNQVLKNIAILPFNAVGVDPVFVQSTETILRLELKRLGDVDVIPEKQIIQSLPEEICVDADCALKIGKELSASHVLICNLSALGEKIIVYFSIVDVDSARIVLNDQTTASNIEDLDVVMKRIAMSILTNEPIEKNAEVGAITQNETKIPLRRGSRKFIGFSFGYLYPQNGYDNSQRSFCMDFRTGYEMNNFTVGMLLAARKGFAMNVFSSYLFSKKDICPYAGGAFGFHWVSHNDYYDGDYYYNDNKNKKSDGFELTVNGGVRIFRTYNFQIITNIAYSYTFNDYDDRALIFTIGLLH